MIRVTYVDRFTGERIRFKAPKPPAPPSDEDIDQMVQAIVEGRDHA